MIPKLISIGGLWKVLPRGIYDATLLEIERCFATNQTRKDIYDGFRRGVQVLKIAGCKIVFLDGSFVSDKPDPGDFDACWEPAGVDVRKLDPVLLDFSHNRMRQKLKYRGEFFPSSVKANGLRTFVTFFQTDKDTGKEKGIICVKLL
jgi:hypothetical protein